MLPHRLSRFRAIPFLVALLLPLAAQAAENAERPNILFVISDDQSYAYASANGSKFVNTPNFDRLCREGVRFTAAYTLSPGCAPSRAGLLTGRYPWELREAGTHASSFPADLKVYPELLAEAGYAIGSAGKGWGPGKWDVTGRPHNPAGPTAGGDKKLAKKSAKEPAKPQPKQEGKWSPLADRFAQFLAARPNDKPFCYWVGAAEPHRSFAKDAGLKAGKKLEDAVVPAFLPDVPEVRSDLLDYAMEIETFDKQLGELLALLEENGVYKNTLVVVTSDNGMPFPRGKALNYEAGTHMPLAVSWPAAVPGGRTVDDLVSLVDLAPTYLEAAGVARPENFRGRSLLPLLKSGKSGLVEPERTAVYSSRERHSSSRYENWTYPIRSLRTREFLYVRNFQPTRWPAGDPVGEDGEPAYTDIDAGPTKTWMIEHRDDPKVRPLFEAAVAKRPAEELYDLQADPENLHNLAADPKHAATLKKLRDELEAKLTATDDPRMTKDGDVWETYPRYSAIRKFPKPE